MKKIFLTIAIIFGILHMAEAVGTMTSVYLNPIGGNDSNAGTLTYPVQSWDKALQLAADNATIYMAWGAVTVASDITVDGSQYGATNITVAQNAGYTGSLFAIAHGATATFSNITLRGDGEAHALITVNGGGTLTIGSSVSLTNGGQISLDGAANPINLTATPPAGMNYQLLTTYQSAADEGRAIVNAGSVGSPLQYFTLITPASTPSITYELGLDGTTIRLYERATGGIFLDPLNGNDAYSGAKSSRPVKTLTKAMAIWDDRNTTPGTVVDIYVLTRITLTANTTLSGGYKLTRFAGDADRSATMTDYLIDYSGRDLTINNFTIDNGSISGIALYSYNTNVSASTLTLGNGANITCRNTSNTIYSYFGTIHVNSGATITTTGNSGSAINTSNTTVTVNNGATLTGSGNSTYYLLQTSGGTITINDGATFTGSGSGTFYLLYTTGSTTINGGTFKNEGTSTTARLIYHGSSTMTINGGTFDAGDAIAIYQGTTNNLTINKCSVTSTNETFGAIYSSGNMYLNGENAKIDGLINLVRAAISYFERFFLYINSPTVTQNYDLRVTGSAGYIPAIIVRSNPSVDLGLYFGSRFTFRSISDYDFAAHAPKGEANRNIVLYKTNAIYVNDYTGNDSNSGASPALPLKTLANAITKTTATKNNIYICDSTLIVNSTQNVTSSTPDTIRPCFFRIQSINMIGITTGGALTLGNVATRIYDSYNTRYTVYMTGGSLVLNSGATLFSQNGYTTTYNVVYMTGGSLTMNNNSRITPSPISSTTYSGSGIYMTGASTTATLNSGSIIENQTSYAIYAANSATVNINGAIIQGTTYSGGTTVQMTGANTVVNMTSGKIINNRNTTTSGASQIGAVYITSGATFNFSGGEISGNNNTTISNGVMYGQQVYISGGTMNFTGGTVIPTDSTRNAIYVYGTGTAVNNTGRLTLSNAAVLDSGFIYCNYPNAAPILLNETLNAGKKFNINLGDNMAGCTLVDGTSSGTYPASVSNFILNPDLNSLMLSQSGNDVIVGSNAIYLHGTSGNDANDGSSAAQAVRTFKRARERLQDTGGNLIVVIGHAILSNANETSDWDLSFNPNAMVQRGLGYTGYLVQIPAGYTLTLSDITLDGNKENVNTGSASNSASVIVYSAAAGAHLIMKDGTKIRDNTSFGVYMGGSTSTIAIENGEITNCSYGIYFTSSGGSFTMTGGQIHSNTSSYGVYTNALRSFTMTGGRVHSNASYGIYNSGATRKTTITGGEISNNRSVGLYEYGGILDFGGTAKIFDNNSTGIYTTNMDSVSITGGQITTNNSSGLGVHRNSATSITTVLSISGGEISNNTGQGVVTSSNDANLYYAIKKVAITGGYFNNNTSYGLNLTNCDSISIAGVQVNGNNYGVYVYNSAIGSPGTFTMSSGEVNSNTSYGIYMHHYVDYKISGNVQITNNKNSGIYSTSLLPSSISDNVLIKGNKATIGGGLLVNQGTVNISDNVTFEADTSTTTSTGGGGAIYIAAAGNVVISGNVKIKDCVHQSTSAGTGTGGSAIYALGKLSMTGGSITGCEANVTNTAIARGTVFVSGTSSDVNLTRVNISNNTAQYGAAVYVNTGGRITLDTDTLTNNTSSSLISYATPVTGNIHITGGGTGRLSLRDKNYIDGDLFLASVNDSIYIDEALLHADVGEFHLLGQTTNGTNQVMTLGTVVVSPNTTTVTDASQFLTRFTLMNQSTGRGLDKGGAGDKHIMIVNQFFIDGTRPDGGNGANPLTAFNKLSQLTASLLNSAYTTVWVSGPVTTISTNETLPAITTNNVNLRRYTGFAVAAQPFEAYDSVMFTVQPGHTLTIPGGNSAANRFTISGEGGSGLTDASIFKNNGTLTIGGYTYLYFNPIAGNGSAIYQNGTLNLSGNIEFELHSTNTVYLAEDKVINITGTFNPPNPIGITVETSPTNTHIPGRIIATGTTTNVPVGAENLFYNELSTPHLPIGRAVNGTTANLMFYIADRNVTGVPIYTTLQDAFDASIAADNDEVRLYGNTEEAVTVDKKLRYNSQGFEVVGSFTLDSTSNVQLLDELLADTLFIRATTFSNKAQLDLNTQDVTIAKAAYLDLRLPEGIIISDWYPFNLPFDANFADVRNADDTTALMLHLQDYAVAAFDGQRRANYGIGNQPSNPDNDWQYFTGSQMTNGTGYMVTTKGIQALRFKAANLNLFSTTTAPMTYYVGSAESPHRGFNYIPQPMPINSTVAAGIPNGGLIQVSEDLSSDRIGAASYVGKTVSASLVVAPYTNYFYQTGANGTVSYTKSTAAATVRSGDAVTARSGQAVTHSDAISSEVPAYYELRFYADNSERYDAFFAAASEYASEGDYEIGRDVAKMGVVGQGAMQIWSKDFDVALCANEVRLKNSSADIPLFIHTPIAGKEYTLKLNNVVSYNEQLWLCRAGKLVQNLTLYREYIIEGTGDTTEEYSLRFLSGTTANEPTGTGEIYVYTENKTIVIVGLQPGDDYLIFDTAGRLHKSGKADSNRTRISAGSGTYVIQTKTNDKTFKAIVK